MKIFREGVSDVLKTNLSLQDITNDVIKKFSTNNIVDREGVTGIGLSTIIWDIH